MLSIMCIHVFGLFAPTDLVLAESRESTVYNLPFSSVLSPNLCSVGFCFTGIDKTILLELGMHRFCFFFFLFFFPAILFKSTYFA